MRGSLRSSVNRFLACLDYQRDDHEKEASMSRRLVPIVAAVAVLVSVAAASTIALPSISTAPREQISLSKDDFDATFAAFEDATSLYPENAAAIREKLRQAGLKRLNSLND
jgi:hypothetical protein